MRTVTINSEFSLSHLETPLVVVTVVSFLGPMKEMSSLARHTPQSQGKARKEGSGDLAYSELFQRPDLVASNQHRDLNLLLGNALLAAHAYMVILAHFVVVHDGFCNYCILREQLAVCKVTRPLFPWMGGGGLQD